MSDADSGKVCVLCGESCENRPRVKDPKGRYFCRECYDKALEEKRRKKHAEQDRRGAKGQSDGDRDSAASDSSDASSSSSAPRAPASLGAEDWGMGLADDLDDSDGFDAPASPAPAADDDDSDATAASGAGVCPNCGADFPLAAVICVNCGYNTTTGHTVEAKTGGTVIAKEDVPTDTMWPSVIGVLAVVFGIGLAGLSVWGVVEMVLGGGELDELEGVGLDPTWNIILSSVMAVPFVLIMLWHGFAGIGLMQWREWGVRQMTLWAKAVIAIVAVVLILLAGLSIVLAIMAGALMEALVMLVMLAVIAGIYLAWPLFILFWLNRDRIEAEVEEWD